MLYGSCRTHGPGCQAGWAPHAPRGRAPGARTQEGAMGRARTVFNISHTMPPVIYRAAISPGAFHPFHTSSRYPAVLPFVTVCCRGPDARHLCSSR